MRAELDLRSRFKLAPIDIVSACAVCVARKQSCQKPPFVDAKQAAKAAPIWQQLRLAFGTRRSRLTFASSRSNRTAKVANSNLNAKQTQTWLACVSAEFAFFGQ